MADTLEELMTDEPVKGGKDLLAVMQDAERLARNALRAELRPGYRALRESHDGLEEALRTLLSCEELEMHWQHPAVEVARAALAKAEALHA